MYVGLRLPFCVPAYSFPLDTRARGYGPRAKPILSPSKARPAPGLGAPPHFSSHIYRVPPPSGPPTPPRPPEHAYFSARQARKKKGRREDKSDRYWKRSGNELFSFCNIKIRHTKRRLTAQQPMRRILVPSSASNKPPPSPAPIHRLCTSGGPQTWF